MSALCKNPRHLQHEVGDHPMESALGVAEAHAAFAQLHEVLCCLRHLLVEEADCDPARRLATDAHVEEDLALRSGQLTSRAAVRQRQEW